MSGRTAMYVTGYNVKSQQKEERTAFEKVSEILIKVLLNQVCSLWHYIDCRN
jgi:hypothetical protein